MNKRPLILVVDDDCDMAKILSRILELEGFSVSVASAGEEALVLIESDTPDLIILDIMMPGLDGYQVLNLVRNRWDTPIIMLTADAHTPSVCRALSAGADDYMRKPFLTRELVARIKAKLRRTGLAI